MAYTSNCAAFISRSERFYSSVPKCGQRTWRRSFSVHCDENHSKCKGIRSHGFFSCILLGRHGSKILDILECFMFTISSADSRNIAEVRELLRFSCHNVVHCTPWLSLYAQNVIQQQIHGGVKMCHGGCAGQGLPPSEARMSNPKDQHQKTIFEVYSTLLKLLIWPQVGFGIWLFFPVCASHLV